MKSANDPSTGPGLAFNPEPTMLPAATGLTPSIAASVDDGQPSKWDADSAPANTKAIPSLINTFQFFALALAVTLAIGFVTVGLGRLLPPFRHQDFKTLALDARLTIPSQALQYLALLAATAIVFGKIWDRPFWQAIAWNGSAAIKRWIPLFAIGILLGLLNGVAGNYLPMPKEAPILNNLMRSPTGAWLMFGFGTTLAPLVEELAFRGFFLPSLINFFDWLGRRNHFGPDSRPLLLSAPSGFSTTTYFASSLIAPVSVLLASIPFVLLHAEQVSGAWAPLLLIGVVSIALCVVRLWTHSLAASTLVHATYNFSLFAGMLIASDGFRHLEKLNG